MRSKFWWENLKERDHLEGLGVDGIIVYYSGSWGNRVGRCGLVYPDEDRDQ